MAGFIGAKIRAEDARQAAQKAAREADRAEAEARSISFLAHQANSVHRSVSCPIETNPRPRLLVNQLDFRQSKYRWQPDDSGISCATIALRLINGLCVIVD